MRRRFARGLILLSGVFWGTSFPVIRLGLIYFGSFIFLFLRFLIAVVLLVPLLYFWGKRGFLELLRDRFVVFTGVLNALGYLFQFIGQNYTYASNAALFINTSPIFTAISAHYVLRERLTVKRILAIVLAFVGAFIIIVDSYGRSFTLSVLGDFLCLLSGLSWGIYITYSKKIADRGDQLMLVASWFVITAVFTFPFAVYDVFLGNYEFNLLSVSIIVYTSVVCTVLAFLSWFKGLSVLEASTSSVYFMVEILISMVLEYLMFGTVFTLFMLLGAGLVILGVYLTDRFYESAV